MTYNESVYMRIHRILTWKRVIAFNVLLILVLVVPLSIRLAQEDTENRSSADDSEEVEVVPPANYPAEAPAIERVKTFYGKTGDTVVVLGENFGDYKWDSKLYVGNTEATRDDVVRWSDGIIEVRVPESARSGGVWVNINGRQARWNGSLYLYDVASSAEVGIRRIADNRGNLYLGKANGLRRGVIEIGYTNDPIDISGLGNITIDNIVNSADSLGKIVRVEFGITAELNRSNTDIMSINYSGIGEIEILRAELYDSNGNMVDVYSAPLAVSVGL